ncbi:MAG: AraC family transcriptional regulator [Chloroflexi bacterium]|nr:AraC family transcriptional regulator [Chloroflexota bacterium]
MVNNQPSAYGFHQAFTTLEASWRTFPSHYLLYAATGAFRLEVAHAQWLLPPQRAAWIAADVPIRVTIQAPVTCSSVLFAKGSIPTPPFDCRVFAISPLAREMIHYAMRWGADRDPQDKSADRFFLTLAEICRELAATTDQFWLPRAHSDELKRALAYTVDHMAAEPNFAEVADIAAVSERTLARRFAEETHMTWRQFLQRARMIRAMELLAVGNTKVIETALATGFSSISAFNNAFKNFTGETPTQYRQRFQRKGESRVE